MAKLYPYSMRKYDIDFNLFRNLLFSWADDIDTKAHWEGRKMTPEELHRYSDLMDRREKVSDLERTIRSYPQVHNQVYTIPYYLLEKAKYLTAMAEEYRENTRYRAGQEISPAVPRH